MESPTPNRPSFLDSGLRGQSRLGDVDAFLKAMLCSTNGDSRPAIPVMKRPHFYLRRRSGKFAFGGTLFGVKVLISYRYYYLWFGQLMSLQ